MELTLEQLKDLFKEKGVMQKDVAKSAKVTEGHLSMVLHGKRESKKLMKKVGKVLGFEIKLVFDGKKKGDEKTDL